MKPQTMPGKESGARRFQLATSTQVKGSLPIPNHTMRGAEAQLRALGFGKTASWDIVEETTPSLGLLANRARYAGLREHSRY